ncbi:MAG: hypothetical protein ABWY56_01275 [Propionibacteriaceae bacterium]
MQFNAEDNQREETDVTAADAGGDSESRVLADGPSTRPVRRASGIYGTIVTAAVLATAGGSLPTLPLAVAVFVTLVVYWLAEEYAELGEHASGGQLPDWAHVRRALAAKWPMVSASYVPLATLLLARLVGASTSRAALVALIVTVLLLMFYGWTAGRSAGLSKAGQLGLTVLAAALGIVMIALKVGIGSLH